MLFFTTRSRVKFTDRRFILDPTHLKNEWPCILVQQLNNVSGVVDQFEFAYSDSRFTVCGSQLTVLLSSVEITRRREGEL